MTDLEAKLERFETLAAECDLIGKLTADANEARIVPAPRPFTTANWRMTCGR